MFTEIVFNNLDLMGVTSSKVEVINSLSVDREVTHGSTVFRSHVSNGSSISKSDVFTARSEEFNKLSDDTTLSEHLSAGQNEISSGHVVSEFTGQTETNDFRQDHGDALSEHDSFGFDTTDTPTEDTKTVDHGSMGVSTDDGVRIEDVLFIVEDDSSQVFQVDLMDNT